MSKSYEQLEAELQYVTWQRDRLAEYFNVVSGDWKKAPSKEYRMKGEVVADIICAVLGGKAVKR